MPYMSPERVKEIRKQIKKEFPEFKFSIRTIHYSTVSVAILSGPIEMIYDDIYHDRYQQVNHYYLDDHYGEHPEVLKVLKRIYEIMNEGNYTEVVDGDYGAVPRFYCDISIGQYNKPYQITTKS